MFDKLAKLAKTIDCVTKQHYIYAKTFYAIFLAKNPHKQKNGFTFSFKLCFLTKKIINFIILI